MDIIGIIEELRTELARINQAIISLEQLAQGQGKRRGRPPAWMKQAEVQQGPKKLGRPFGSKNKPKTDKEQQQ